MTYETSQAFRMALERRLVTRSTETGIAVDRLRRRVVERIVARLEAGEPGRWVLKGGMALEVRLRDNARLTKDIDLGLRDDVDDPGELRERLIDALGVDADGDGFVFTAGAPEQLGEDGAGHQTWRVKVAAALAGRTFGGIQLDISTRAHELAQTEPLALPDSLDFADIPAPVVEIVDVHRHAAEKFHAMFRDFGDRENSRVRDLVDLVILIEHDLLAAAAVGAAIQQVWAEREGHEPPSAIPPLPESWPDRYERLAIDHDLETRSFPAAVAVVSRLWADMLSTEEA